MGLALPTKTPSPANSFCSQNVSTLPRTHFDSSSVLPGYQSRSRARVHLEDCEQPSEQPPQGPGPLERNIPNTQGQLLSEPAARGELCLLGQSPSLVRYKVSLGAPADEPPKTVSSQRLFFSHRRLNSCFSNDVLRSQPLKEKQTRKPETMGFLNGI